MPQPLRFNVRVYGICIVNNQLLVNEELIRGRQVTKLPGGGLELGEGTRDGLRREWQEELGLDITVGHHFYTTDYFVPSAYDDSQVISIYYRVSTQEAFAIHNTEANERTYWLPLNELTEDTFTLPIDKVVGNIILQQWKHQVL